MKFACLSRVGGGGCIGGGGSGGGDGRDGDGGGGGGGDMAACDRASLVQGEIAGRCRRAGRTAGLTARGRLQLGPTRSWNASDAARRDCSGVALSPHQVTATQGHPQ